VVHTEKKESATAIDGIIEASQKNQCFSSMTMLNLPDINGSNEQNRRAMSTGGGVGGFCDEGFFVSTTEEGSNSVGKREEVSTTASSNQTFRKE
jgi:hypothetical protein